MRAALDLYCVFVSSPGTCTCSGKLPWEVKRRPRETTRSQRCSLPCARVFTDCLGQREYRPAARFGLYTRGVNNRGARPPNACVGPSRRRRPFQPVGLAADARKRLDGARVSVAVIGYDERRTATSKHRDVPVLHVPLDIGSCMHAHESNT
jgi:hypothetical protein